MPGLNKVMFGLKMKIILCISKVRILNEKKHVDNSEYWNRNSWQSEARGHGVYDSVIVLFKIAPVSQVH